MATARDAGTARAHQRALGLPPRAAGGGDLRRARHADRAGGRGRDAAARLGVGALARRAALLRRRRAVADLRPADLGDRRARGSVRQRLPRGAPAMGALRALPLRLHAGDAGDRAGRRPRVTLRLLGGDDDHLLPADRVRQREREGPTLRAPGAPRHRGGRAGAARRDHPDLPRHRHALDHRAQRHGAPGPPALPAHPDPGARGRVHQVGAGAVPLLAAERHGGTHARERVPALGHPWSRAACS